MRSGKAMRCLDGPWWSLRLGRECRRSGSDRSRMFVGMGRARFFKAPLGATPRRVEGSMPLLRSLSCAGGSRGYKHFAPTELWTRRRGREGGVPAPRFCVFFFNGTAESQSRHRLPRLTPIRGITLQGKFGVSLAILRFSTARGGARENCRIVRLTRFISHRKGRLSRPRPG